MRELSIGKDSAKLFAVMVNIFFATKLVFYRCPMRRLLPCMARMDGIKLKSSVTFSQCIGILGEGHSCISIYWCSIWALFDLLSRICEYEKKKSYLPESFICAGWFCIETDNKEYCLRTMQFHLDSFECQFLYQKNTSSHILRNRNKWVCTVFHIVMDRLVTKNKFRCLCTVLRSDCRHSHKTGKTQET